MTNKHTQNFVLHNSLTNFHASTVTTNAHGNEKPNCFEIVMKVSSMLFMNFKVVVGF